MNGHRFMMAEIETYGLAPETAFGKWALAFALALAAFLVLRGKTENVIEFLISDFQIWFSESQLRGIFRPAYTADSSPGTTSADSSVVYAEDAAFLKLRTGLSARPTPPVEGLPSSKDSLMVELPAVAIVEEPKPPVDPLKEFFAWVPQHLVKLSNLHQKISRGLASDMSQETIRDFWKQTGELKNRASLPELLPVQQMAAALEGLIKQMGERAHDVTLSTQRTLAGGIDLLKKLCAGLQDVELLTNPPFRMLVVDDDPICRVAVTYALKKAFDQPDLAENGESALALAARESFDVIFLDVQMPGMNGFELCSKIHETSPNRATPVVFVTSMNDFNARAKSSISGGTEVIGKPFLSFEIAVKALTLGLRHRLRADAKAVSASQKPSQAQQPALAIAKPQPAVGRAVPAPAQIPNHEKRVSKELPPSGPVAGIAAAGSQKDALAALRMQASSTLIGSRDELQKIDQTTEESARWKSLAKLYIGVQSLARALAESELRPASQLCSALEGLFKKLQENPKNATPSTLHAVEASLHLLDDLCAPGVSPDLAANPVISILVVDDDPLTRRAITGALQTVFLRPDNAEDGESALALAAKKPFDVIFMDVQMPGMDGFTTCSRIHEAKQNLATPVIFVTSQTDAKSRAQSALCGGSDFITKPFSPVEITVKALTYALRLRLTRADGPEEKLAGEKASPLRQTRKIDALRTDVSDRPLGVAKV